MPKFFINNENILSDNRISIEGNDYNHIKNVLRKNINDELNICNSENSKNYLCKIIDINDKQVVLHIENEIESNSESNINITIFQGLPKAEKMELIIQKATELGVTTIVPTIMKRCVVKVEEKDKQKKVIRWQKIAEVAAKQSGRDKITQIEEFKNIKNICEKIKDYDAVLLAYENEKNNSIKREIQLLKEMYKDEYKIAVIIGPEGGIDAEEVELLQTVGAKVVTLGNRILRTETVSLTITSILMYELGDLN